MGGHDSLSTSTHWNHMRMVNVQSRSGFNPLTAKLFHCDLHLFEVSENYSDLTNGGQLHQFATKNKKIPRGMPPDPPNLRFPFAQLQISIQAIFYRGSNYLISKIPQHSKIRPPLQKFLYQYIVNIAPILVFNNLLFDLVQMAAILVSTIIELSAMPDIMVWQRKYFRHCIVTKLLYYCR